RDLRLPRRAARLPLRRARELSRRERQGSLAARHGFSQETSEKVSCGRANRGFSADATPPPAGPDVLCPALTIASSLGRLRHPIGDADRTAHAGAAEAAIAHRVLRQILLVVVLGKIECRRIENFGGDRTEAPRLELLVVHRFRRLRGATLLGGERVD